MKTMKTRNLSWTDLGWTALMVTAMGTPAVMCLLDAGWTVGELIEAALVMALFTVLGWAAMTAWSERKRREEALRRHRQRNRSRR